MRVQVLTICTGMILATLAASPGQALTMKECSAKYKAAQTAGTLNGQKWNDFRKAQCGSDAAAAPAAPAAAPAKTTASAPAAPKPPAAAPMATGNAVFPNAVSPKYSKESEGKARMHTCLDQYNANKASNGNGVCLRILSNTLAKPRSETRHCRWP